jgi:hypothetical protein
MLELSERILSGWAYPGMRLSRIVLIFVASVFIATAQPTLNVLSRTMRVQSQYGTGTIFNIDVDGREYWVTAAHILTGAAGKPYGRVTTKTVNLKILNPGGEGLQWIPVKFTVLQPPEDVDVVALVSPTLLMSKTTNLSPPASSVGLMLGGPCEFLGYALDGGWREKWRLVEPSGGLLSSTARCQARIPIPKCGSWMALTILDFRAGR